MKVTLFLFAALTVVSTAAFARPGGARMHPHGPHRDVVRTYPRHAHRTDEAGLSSATLSLYSWATTTADNCENGYCRTVDPGVIADATLFVASGGSAEPGAVLRELMDRSRAAAADKNVTDLEIAERFLGAVAR